MRGQQYVGLAVNYIQYGAHHTGDATHFQKPPKDALLLLCAYGQSPAPMSTADETETTCSGQIDTP